VSDCGDAISDLDGLTQQNAALVLELAEASRSMSDRASRMHEALGHFRLGDEPSSRLPEAARIYA
jgi:methyl-accepting chemotaxis protein